MINKILLNREHNIFKKKKKQGTKYVLTSFRNLLCEFKKNKKNHGIILGDH